MKVTLYKTSDCLDNLAADWDRLFSLSSHQTPFSSRGFIKSWYESYPEEKPFIVTVSENGFTMLIAPLVTGNDGWLKMAGYKRGDYNAILYDNGKQEAFLYFIRHLIQQRYKLALSNQHESDTTYTLLPDPFVRNKHKWFRYQLQRYLSLVPFTIIKEKKDCPYIDQGYKEQVLSRINNSKSRQQRIKALSKQGHLAYKCLYDQGSITELLPTFFDLHITEWEQTPSPSLFIDPANKHFYTLLTQHLNAHSVRLDVLYLDDKIIAMHYGFEDEQNVYYYKPCYDSAFKKNSPGSILLNYIVANTLEAGKNFDFLKGAESYKNYYSDEFRILRQVQIQPSMLVRLIPSLCR